MRSARAAISRVKSRPRSRMNFTLSALDAGKELLKAVRSVSELKEAERTFAVTTLYSESVSLIFSVIVYLILGPLAVLGVLAQVALFQRRLFRDLDRLVFEMEHT